MEFRNLDGVYFRVQRNNKWQSICFSDLTEEEKNKIKENLGISDAASIIVGTYEELEKLVTSNKLLLG